MWPFKYFFFLLLFVKLTCFNVFGQQSKTLIDSIVERIETVGNQKSKSLLFVHFDKNIYSNNENAWFTAYLLKNNSNLTHHTLSVALVRNDDRSVVTEAKFLMDSGIAMGNMFLPDSLPIGNYSFICYTNLFTNNYPLALFVQPITIKTNKINGFTAKLNFIDTISPNLDTARMLLRAINKDGTLVKKANVIYFIENGIGVNQKKLLQTDNFGEATIPIPLKEITAVNNILQVEINNGSEVKSFNMKLPVYKKQVQVQFYPEGGSLVDELKNIVGWEVTDATKNPLQIDASVYKNGIFLQTISTNEYGMGTFSIKPEKGSRYYVKLHTIDTEAVHLLPASLQSGTILTIPHALTSDTLYAYMYSEGATGVMNLLVHNYRYVFVNFQIQSSGKSMLIKVPLNEIPKGINTITLLDNIGRPVMERMFFAHYDKRAIITIKTDSDLYSTRQKVTLKFNITNVAHQPLVSVVSMACVQNSRFDIKKTMDIESYLYLTNELAGFSFKKNCMNYDTENEAYLEQLFLVKGWRRYTWKDIEKDKVSGKIPAVNSLRFTGKVTKNNNTIKKPLQIKLQKFITSNMSALDYVSTDSLGNFELNPEAIVSEPGKKYEMTVNDDWPERFRINVINPYFFMNKNLASSLHFQDFAESSFIQSSQAFNLQKNEIAKTLETVVITTKNDQFRGSNACGDYVCSFNILNCINHVNEGYLPVVGKRYGVRSFGQLEVMQEVYRGCRALELQLSSEHRFAMEGIYSKKEFYVTDFSKSPISESQYISTIYWNHAEVTDNNGASEISFYTGDITGKFKIVIQGIAGEDDVVYGEHFFEVKEP